MREITTHRSPGLNDLIRIYATDEPGPGGANSRYEVRYGRGYGHDIRFQKGTVAENGVNGISNEVLLAILIDRLDGFQRGPFACSDNDLTITHLEQAAIQLSRRTQERINRGVEGKLLP